MTRKDIVSFCQKHNIALQVRTNILYLSALSDGILISNVFLNSIDDDDN